MRARAQVWCLAVSSLGDFVVSGGADRSLRVWQRTEEPFFVEEEKEKRLESLFEIDLEVLDLPQHISRCISSHRVTLLCSVRRHGNARHVVLRCPASTGITAQHITLQIIQVWHRLQPC